MIVKESPLILNEFLLLKSNYEFIEPKTKDGININDVYNTYLVDIDYSIQGDENHANIFVKVEVNNAEYKECGYSLMVEGVGIFGFDEDSNLDKEEKGNLVFYSAISICISNLRAILTVTLGFLSTISILPAKVSYLVKKIDSFKPAILGER